MLKKQENKSAPVLFWKPKESDQKAGIGESLDRKPSSCGTAEGRGVARSADSARAGGTPEAKK